MHVHFGMRLNCDWRVHGLVNIIYNDSVQEYCLDARPWQHCREIFKPMLILCQKLRSARTFKVRMKRRDLFLHQ